MAWRLEIHHIGLDRRGDATLILAINDGMGANQAVQRRSMLIDGGMHLEHAFVDNYIQAQMGVVAGAAVPPLDVMVVTHYDVDHFRGITSLLRLGGAAGPPNIYDNVIIFDQGFSAGSTDNSYLVYLQNVALRGARTRVTRNVLGLAAVPPVPPAPPGGWQASNWLLNDEIMWTNGAGAPVTPAALLGAVAGTNLNPPTVTCVAVNQFVQGAVGRQTGGVLGAERLKNEHSLGFIVQFNHFRYFIAGDLETAEEDAVQNHVNPADDLTNRVIAIHASHHGGNTSTSRAFVDRLKADAAFISCGNANQHVHPSQEVCNVLEGYPWAALAHPAEPPPSPDRPVYYYLTGYQVINIPPNLPQSYGDPNVSIVAGDPQAVPRVPGHIVLRVSLPQSQNDQRGEFYFGVREATRCAAQRAGATAINATAIGVAAANAIDAAGIDSRLQAVQAAVTAAANAAGAGGAVIAAANAAATAEASGVGPSGVNYSAGTIANHTAVQTIGNGGTQIEAAAAGAAAGAAFASGARHDAANATRDACLGANVAALAALNARLQCFLAIVVAVGVGLFNVELHDYFTAVNPYNTTHYG